MPSAESASSEPLCQTQPTLASRCVAEAIGTFLLVLFGCGAVHAAVLTGAQSGLWQVAIVWGVAIMLAIFSIGGVSGAHINPAMTIALALWRRCSWSIVGPYIVSQLAGAFVAAAVLCFLFGGFLAAKEAAKGVTRGQPGSEVTAMCYGEYSPNPGPIAAADGPYSASAHERLKSLVPWRVAFGAEVLGTLILAFVVFAVTDDRNHGGPPPQAAPVFIGLTVAALISVLAPLTQACFNPARDFGPRLLAYFAGWGQIAWPLGTNWDWLTIYILAPIVGAVLGAGLYERLVRPAFVSRSSTESIA